MKIKFDDKVFFTFYQWKFMVNKIKFFVLGMLLFINSISATETQEIIVLDKIIMWLESEIIKHKEAADYWGNSFEYFYLVGKIGQAECTISYIEELKGDLEVATIQKDH